MSEEYLGNRLCNAVWKRLERAYPGMGEREEIRSGRYVFAKGLCLHKLLWVFIISALIGDLFETVFVWATTGVWMSRTSVIYGTFSIVWGFGAVIITVVMRRLTDREDRYIFLSGAVLWGVYEYTCSVISEVVFGRTFWDYSDMMFNINGRTNLLFCLFGGILCVVWVKLLYPLLSRLIEKIPPAIGVVTTWCITVLMIADLLLPGAVLSRYVDRLEGAEAQNVLEEFIDANYSDEFIESIWPNMQEPGGTPVWQQGGAEQMFLAIKSACGIVFRRRFFLRAMIPAALLPVTAHIFHKFLKSCLLLLLGSCGTLINACNSIIAVS